MISPIDGRLAGLSKIARLAILSDIAVAVGSKSRMLRTILPKEKMCMDCRPLPAVSIIEKRLPPDIRKDWAKLVSSDTSPVEKKDKFPSLFKFLLHQKRAIEYDSADLRKSAQQAINHASVVVKEIDESNHSDESRTADSRCIFHGNARHENSECKLYLAKTCEERMTMLEEKGACWSCLKIGHRIRDCRRKKICGENGCTRTHHKTIRSEATPINVSARASACSSPLRGTCLVQV